MLSQWGTLTYNYALSQSGNNESENALRHTARNIIYIVLSTKKVQETIRTYSLLQKSTINMQAGYICLVRSPSETWIMSEHVSTSSNYPIIKMTEHLTCYSTIKQEFRDIIFDETMDVFFSKNKK